MTDLAQLSEILSLPMAFAIVYFVWHLLRRAREDQGWRKDREAVDREIEGKIKRLHEWRDRHEKSCTTEHREIVEKVDRVHSDLTEMKVAVARIETWLKGHGPRPEGL